MSRAYIRLDPGFDEAKYDYPDGAYAAFVAVLCLAEKQSRRGRFRSTDYLRRMLGKRGRWVTYLVEHGDLIERDGQLYLDGWDEWQEGDWKVGERVARLRSRIHRCNGASNGDVTAGRLSGGGGYSAGDSGDHSGALTEPKPSDERFPPLGSVPRKAS